MLWTKSQDFYIDDQPMLDCAEDVDWSFSDLDSSDSGRDESGVMHREVVREKVGTWSFQYPILDEEDYAYLLGLLAGKPTFTFRHPGGSCTAYCSKYGVVVHNRRLGLYKNMKFNIIEC